MSAEADDSLKQLLEILDFRSKRALVRHCKGISIHQRDFVGMILAAQKGDLSPYKYANYYSEVVPEHLVPSEVERKAFEANDVGKFKTAEAKKFSTKTFQLFRERRILAAHLLYASNCQYWHIFSFDNRDRSRSANHWNFGPHIHYVCDLWPELTMVETWERITGQRAGSPSGLHIRYSRD